MSRWSLIVNRWSGNYCTVNDENSGSRTRQSTGNQHTELESPRSGERGYQNIEPQCFERAQNQLALSTTFRRG